jgi:hypothetical protein
MTFWPFRTGRGNLTSMPNACERVASMIAGLNEAGVGTVPVVREAAIGKTTADRIVAHEVEPTFAVALKVGLVYERHVGDASRFFRAESPIVHRLNHRSPTTCPTRRGFSSGGAGCRFGRSAFKRTSRRAPCRRS